MSNREFFLERWQAEHAPTLRVLKAVPAARLDYRPHAKSRSAGELVHLLVYEEETGIVLCEQGEIHWNEPKGFPPLEEMIAAYEKHHRALSERLQKLDDTMWSRQARFLVNEMPVMEETVGAFFWGTLFDAVHHRGQLTVYLRPMGGKVPSIYGPSADDAGS